MNETKRHKLCCFLLAFVGMTYAQEELSSEFLEYLSDYETVDGELVDPTEFAEALEELSTSSQQAATNAEVTEKDTLENEGYKNDK